MAAKLVPAALVGVGLFLLATTKGVILGVVTITSVRTLGTRGAFSWLT